MADRYLRSTDGSDTDDGSTWALAKASLAGIAAIDTAGDTIWISQNHNEASTPGTINLAGTIAAPVKLLCGNDAAEPPTALATTAVCGWNAASTTVAINGHVYAYGITFRHGIGGGALNTTLALNNSGAALQQYESCNFETLGEGLASKLMLGSAGNTDPTDIDWKDCWYKGAKSNNPVEIVSTRFFWQGGGFLSGNTIDTTAFKVQSTGEGALIELSGLDLTNMGTATDLFLISGITGRVIIRDCKLPSGWTGVLASSVSQASRCSMYNCDVAGSDTNFRMWVADYTGQALSETTIVRSGGASDGTTALAWKVITNTLALDYISPFNTDEIIRWNETTGSAITATIEFVHDSQGAGSGGAMQDDEIWLEVLYAGTSGESIGTFVSNRKADILATAVDHTTSSETWTTTGLTSPVKQKLSVTFTPQEKGYIKARVYVGKASKTVYICPKLEIT